MKSGVIGQVEGTFGPFDSFHTEAEDGLLNVVDVRKTRTTDSGNEIIIGAAAKQKEVQSNTVEIEGTNVEEIKVSEISADYTEFIAVPGEFVIADNSSGTFIFDLIGRKTGTHITRSSIDIDGFLDGIDNIQAWKVGFYDHFGMADNGTLYGNNLFDDDDFGEIISIADKNQIGLTYVDDEDTKFKLNMTESGYIEIYTPDLDSEEFAQFITENVYDYLRVQ